MDGAVFISGGSGFLGTYLVKDLLERGCSPVYVLMRGDDTAACETRLRNLWWAWPELRDAVGRQVLPVLGDITQAQLGLSDDTFKTLTASVRYIIHAAAEIGVNQTPANFARVNVDGTANMLLFAHAAHQQGGLERFVHISTAYVAGTRTGVVYEDELVEGGFNSLYEQSKLGAEKLVRDCFDTLPATIVRPAQIVGDTDSGFVTTFNTLYYPLKLYLKGRLPILPVDPHMKVSLAPVDYVARVTIEALFNPKAVRMTFHAIASHDQLPDVASLLDFVRTWSTTHLDFDPGQARCIPLPGTSTLGRARNMAARSTQKRKSGLQNLLALAPYFREDRIYDTTNTKTILGLVAPSWQGYMGPLLEYATRKGFLNHTGRSVFEQMLVRMASKRTPINYYDVTATGVRKTSGAEVRATIMQAAHALKACGIQSGDRVALTGFNSVRYFIADAAIGLVGATSVPLYYTLPATDIVELVARSNAKLMLVGTEKLLESLPPLLDVPVVSLLDKSTEECEPWESFLALGQGDTSSTEPFPTPAYDDVATIRYTSGTTGNPKGVLFNHAQLRWMGEVMPSLLDWKVRNNKLRYLSFLPMSHVVEGILVSYAPYYMLTDVEFYYLNDFPLLAETLPKIRPTLFFSVPRFYEKVWNQFESSSIGKRYLSMKEGPAKRALAKVARAGLLRKAGLDRCKQLLVGSAPVSMELLESYRELGIEIYNAFGVTEAPLITLSRLGHNELGSVGDLLPETQVRLADDGEVLVAGPQVTLGYDGMGSCLDDEGFFATGDFGSYSPQGKLILEGRKKELLVTSYGKNISPEKIETLLKAIPGVSEALLVGEGKPYVGALLWMEDDAPAFDGGTIDEAILARNLQLSHPEQVKRWVVMDTPLSIAEGDLTPNLKLRRKNVAQRYADTIEAIYNDRFGTEAVPHALHKGAQE